MVHARPGMDSGGEYAGLVRVWRRPNGPRLALIGEAFAVLDAQGDAQAVSEVDDTNDASTR